MIRTSGFVLDLPVGAWLITAVPDFAGAPRILKQCATRAECVATVAGLGQGRDFVFVCVAEAEHWKAEA